MIRGLTFFSLGAGLMYFLDPDCGRRRRALVRDQWASAVNHMDHAIAETARDLDNRVTGLVSELGSLVSHDAASDSVVEARVRSKLGRVVSHPHGITVTARKGRVTLSGPILANEVEPLLAAMAEVRGVCEVENRLEPHEQPGEHPALQGGRRRRGEQPEYLQENWSPTMWLAAGTLAAVPALSLARRLGLGSLVPLALGAALIARTEQRGASRRQGRRRGTSSKKRTSSRTPFRSLSQGMGI